MLIDYCVSVKGLWTLDKKYDGIKNTQAKGIIYVITGAGGQDLYNPEQENDPDSWQKFTSKFVSTVHSLSIADINNNELTIRQIDTNGKVVDHFKLKK